MAMICPERIREAGAISQLAVTNVDPSRQIVFR
jgi:hypothetical protein